MGDTRSLDNGSHNPNSEENMEVDFDLAAAEILRQAQESPGQNPCDCGACRV